MSGSPGPVGSSLDFLQTKWLGEGTSHRHRAYDCACVPRGRDVCPTESVRQRHEPERARARFEAQRSSRARSALLCRCAVGSGHHVAQSSGQGYHTPRSFFWQVLRSWFWQLKPEGWSEEVLQTMLQLAHARAREAPPHTQFPAKDLGQGCWLCVAQSPSPRLSWSQRDTPPGVERMGKGHSSLIRSTKIPGWSCTPPWFQLHCTVCPFIPCRKKKNVVIPQWCVETWPTCVPIQDLAPAQCCTESDRFGVQGGGMLTSCTSPDR